MDGGHIRRLRKARGFSSRKDLARASGVSASTIRDIENDAREGVGVDVVYALADALGVAHGELLRKTRPHPVVAEFLATPWAQQLPDDVRQWMAEHTPPGDVTPEFLRHFAMVLWRYDDD